MSSITGLYFLTRSNIDTYFLMMSVEAALRGGARVVQYRDKASAFDHQLAQAAELKALCREFSVPLIINDDVILAKRVGADGVHLGEQDTAIESARDFLGIHTLIGVSCYNEIARAEAAAKSGADYIAFGAFFESGTKPLARRASLDLLQTSAYLGLARVAIGGVTADNADRLIAAGADAVAVLAAVWDAADIEAAARAISSLFHQSNTGESVQ